MLTEQDNNVIRKISHSWEKIWNSHKMDGLFDLFWPEADFVNVYGLFFQGIEQIHKHHTKVHATKFRESTFTVLEVNVQAVTEQVALVHLDWTLHGEKNPDGTLSSPRQGIFTWILVKRGQEWRIRAVHNTNRVILRS